MLYSWRKQIYESFNAKQEWLCLKHKILTEVFNAVPCQIAIYVPWACSCISLSYHCFAWKRPEPVQQPSQFYFLSPWTAVYIPPIPVEFIHIQCIIDSRQHLHLCLCRNEPNKTVYKEQQCKYWKPCAKYKTPTMETVALRVNFGGRLSGRLSVCQNSISKRSHWLSLKNVIRPLPYYVIRPTWNVWRVLSGIRTASSLWLALVDDLTFTIILLLWQFNYQFLIMVKISSDVVQALRGLSMPGWGFNAQISFSLFG